MEKEKIIYKGKVFKRDEKGYYRNKILGPLHKVKYQSENNLIVPHDKVVYHKDGDPSNNELSNLEVMNKIEYVSLHHTTKIKNSKSIVYKGCIFTYNENTGYYRNKRLGNLHRVKFESENNTIIPKGYHIHHKDGDPTNNELSNLEMMSASDHSKLHSAERTISQETRKKISLALKGREFSDETRAKISEAKTKEITEEMRQDVRESITSKDFEAKYGYGRVVWERIKREIGTMKSDNFKEITEEMKQDVINGITYEEFRKKHKTYHRVWDRIRKMTGTTHINTKKNVYTATPEMIEDLKDGMGQRPFKAKYNLCNTVWARFRKELDIK